MQMPDHIVAHSLQVCRVAVFLTDILSTGKTTLNRDLVQASALLHDITKTRSFKTNENHAETGSLLISRMGYPEVGSIVGQHVRLNEYDGWDRPREAQIVNYSDKRVLHDRIVSLEERMAYVQERYGGAPGASLMIDWHRKKLKQLEEWLFSRLPFSPNELPARVAAGDETAALSDYCAVCGKISS
jgi:putative nucleotidyltransferase with HDIG domain